MHGPTLPRPTAWRPCKARKWWRPMRCILRQSNLIAWIATLCIISIAQVAIASVTVIEPTCEYRQNPLDIDAAQPRLSWKLNSDQRGQRQSAYQIRVASSGNLLATNSADLWDSGKVDAPDSIQVAYPGKA